MQTSLLITSPELTLAEKLIEQAKKNPYFHLGEEGERYMERYWLMPFDPNGSQNIRIHRIMRSDKDRHLHDHPWDSTSVILLGGYWEIVPYRQDQDPALDNEQYLKLWRAPGDVVTRKAYDRHRIIIPDGGEAWSMFIMGPLVDRAWGFYTDKGKIYWRDYLEDYITETSTDKLEKA